MAITTNRIQVDWGGTPDYDILITTGSTGTSNLITLNQAAVAAGITIKVTLSASGSAGDVVDIYALGTCGDPDNDAGGDEFASTSTDHAQFVGQLTFVAKTTRVITIAFPITAKITKLYVINNTTLSATVSGVVEEKVG